MGDIQIILPDGSERKVEEGATIQDVAYSIGTGLGDDCIAGKIDGELVAKEEEVEDGASIEIVTPQSDDYLNVLRHSAAHVLAQAVQRLYPDAKIGMGPWTDEGFYYDFDNLDIDKEDFERIEAEMQKIIDQDLEIERVEPDSEKEAEDILEGEPYKKELLEEFRQEGKDISFYRQGEFIDLCKGPHLDSTGEINAFKLLSVAAAYWKGDEENKMLTRIYATAFPNKSQLQEFIEKRKEAEKRDHRKIGKEMDLFSIPPHSPGCAHFHPKGMILRRELEEFIREKNRELGYREVWTPELNKTELWKKTGHYEHFKEENEMFAWEQNDETEYGLKPMNCANHSHIYNSQKRSYRDLPIKLSEFGTCYRNEQSGELSGLFRVRGFTQDDGHAYIRRNQIEQEILQTLAIIEETYNTLGFNLQYGLETRPENSLGDIDLWNHAEESLKSALESKKIDYIVEEGEGAFYGPKISVIVEDAIGREWQVGTVQLDFVQPERLNLTYRGQDNEEHRPVMIHRAILGTFERFMGVMVEHFAGNFPTWLAPEQVRILPISDDQMGYAKEVQEKLSEFRVEVEERSWTLGKKIQTAHDDRVPYMVIVGGNEEEEGTISVRDREEREEKGIAPEEFVSHLEKEVEEKEVEPSFLR